MSGRIIRKRCVVLMGKSGAGKSTVANMLVGYDPMSSFDPPFGVSQQVLQSVTREVKHEVYEFTKENITYSITVIDTVGLFDTEIEGQDPIFDKIETYFKDYIDGINVVLFVFKKGRLTAEEQQVFSFIRERFVTEISPISALAVTGCENDSPEAREELVKEFGVNEATQQIAGQMELGIHPVGFPNIKTMMPAFQEAYKESIKNDQEMLMDLILKADKLHLTRKLFEEKVKPVIKYITVPVERDPDTYANTSANTSDSGCTIL